MATVLFHQGHHVANLAADGREGCLVGLFHDKVHGHAQNAASGAVIQLDVICIVNGNDPTGDRFKHIVHQRFHFRNFGQLVADLLEEPGVFNGHGRLIGKGGHQIPVAIPKNAIGNAVVGVNHADGVRFHAQGHAQNGAQVVADDALLAREPVIFLGVGRHQWFARFKDRVEDGATNLGRINRLAVDVTRRPHLQITRVFVHQH